MEGPTTYLVRVRLPDRPGGLGLVASRLGGLKGDVKGLEILERGGGFAIDELLVSLPADVSVELIIKEVGADEGVDVEDIRRLDGPAHDPQLGVLEAASTILGAETRDELASALVEHVCRAGRASWASVVEHGGGVLASWGDPPEDRWLRGFISGTVSGEAGIGGPTPETNAIWLPLAAASAALVVGRDNIFRTRERERLTGLASISDVWFRRLRECSCEAA